MPQSHQAMKVIVAKNYAQFIERSYINSIQQTTDPMYKFYVKNLPIRLGQFLKLANLVQDGMEAKIRIQEEEVSVNDIVETRRGRQLISGDRVSFNDTTLEVTSEPTVES